MMSIQRQAGTLSTSKQVIKTFCELCPWNCCMNVYVEDGVIVEVEGMTEHPYNQGELYIRGEHAYLDQRSFSLTRNRLPITCCRAM